MCPRYSCQVACWRRKCMPGSAHMQVQPHGSLACARCHPPAHVALVPPTLSVGPALACAGMNLGRPPAGAGAAASSTDCRESGECSQSSQLKMQAETQHRRMSGTRWPSPPPAAACLPCRGSEHAPGRRRRPLPGSSAAGWRGGRTSRPPGAAAGSRAASRRPECGRGRRARWTPASGRAGRAACHSLRGRRGRDWGSVQGCRGLQRGERLLRWRHGGVGAGLGSSGGTMYM